MLNPKRYSVMRDAPQDVGLGLFPEGNPGEMQVSEADILAEMIRRANDIKEPIQATAPEFQEPAQSPVVPEAPKATTPELDIGNLAAASRARNYALADSQNSAANMGDFMSLASRAVAGIGNVRGKKAETAVPNYMKQLKETAAARAKMMNDADENYQKAMVSRSLMDMRSKTDGSYKADLARSQAALNDARAKGLITEEQYRQAILDPNSPESEVIRSAAERFGIKVASTTPGSAVNPVLKNLANAYTTDKNIEAGENKTEKVTKTAKEIADERNKNNLIIAKQKAEDAKEAAKNKAAVPKTPSADQSKAATYATRMEDAIKNLEDIEAKGFDRASLEGTTQSKLPEALKPENAKLQDQAERNFINAQLRRESGAAISPTEFASAEVQYFPRVNDTPAVKAQKRANMKRAIAGMKAEAGPVSLNAINEQMGPTPTTKPERKIQNGWIYERQPDGKMKPVGKAP